MIMLVCYVTVPRILHYSAVHFLRCRVSVSRAIKPLVEDVRPTDYFSQKNCALQYSAMLDKTGTPKRKRSSEGGTEVGK